MHLKKKVVTAKGKKYEYADIVQSVRKRGKIKHEIIRPLGRMETKEDWEWARSVLEGMKQGKKVPEAKGLKINKQFELGGIWIADKLWKMSGVQDALEVSFQKRKTKFNLERMVFLLVVNRLYKPLSDRKALKWIREKVYTSGDVKKHWVYSTLDKLVEEKNKIESVLLKNLKKNLGISLDLVFYDLTSSYFEGEGPKLTDFGLSRDNRPDKEQIVLGVVMADGIPILHRVWPGNTTDKSTLKKAVEELQQKFNMKKVIFVADRGIISTENIDELEDKHYDYILSTHRRKNNIAEKLLPKSIRKKGKIVAKEVWSDKNRRYILCLNREERKKRLKKLRKIRKTCKKKLSELKNRFEKSQTGRGRPMTKKGLRERAKKILGRNKRLFETKVDETLEWKFKKKSWKYEKAIAGKFLLVTTSDLKPDYVVSEYKNLKDVEQAFDDLKHLLNIRPFYHSTDKRTKAHAFICVLGLLVTRLIQRKTDTTFEKTMEKLEPLKLNDVEFRSKKFYQRNEMTSEQKKIFKILNVERPPKIFSDKLKIDL